MNVEFQPFNHDLNAGKGQNTFRFMVLMFGLYAHRQHRRIVRNHLPSQRLSIVGNPYIIYYIIPIHPKLEISLFTKGFLYKRLYNMNPVIETRA